MKTFYPINLKNIAFSLMGLIAIFTTSCGSYQNSSYYDNDGVYGSDRPTTEVENKYSEQNLEKSNEYTQQFRDMQEDYSYFTDVDNYNSQAQDTVVTVYRNESNNNYAGWGNNSSNVTINYYDNGWGWNNWYSPYWGYSNIGWGAGWGWNSWYGNNWGWGWNSWYGPGWGWGWNNWYGNNWGWNGYYGNNWGWNGYRGRNVAYNGGPRGGNGYYNSGSGRNASNYNGGRRTNPNFNGTPRNTNPRGTFQNPRSSQNNVTPRTNTPRNTNTPRENTTVTPRSNNNYSTPRSNNNTSTPRSNNYSTPRSSSSGGFGGSSSGGGGGRSSGGGGGRGGYFDWTAFWAISSVVIAAGGVIAAIALKGVFKPGNYIGMLILPFTVLGLPAGIIGLIKSIRDYYDVGKYLSIAALALLGVMWIIGLL